MMHCSVIPSIEEIHAILQERVRDLSSSRQAHAFAVSIGLDSHRLLASCLIRVFSSHGSLVDASRAFSHMREHNVFACSAMISSYVRHGYAKRAIRLYYGMIRSHIRPDGHAFVAALKACSHALSCSDGMLIHSHVLESSLERDMQICNTLIDMYGRMGDVYDAQKVFDSIAVRDLVSWNSLLGGCPLAGGMGPEALRCFEHMQKERIRPDAITFVNVLKSCRSREKLDAGKVVHFYIIETNSHIDAFLCSSLIDMYCKCGSVEDARVMFDGLTVIDVAIWNAIIAGYVLNGSALEAIHLFEKMHQSLAHPDKITLVNVIKAVSVVQDLLLGRLIHALGIEIACESDVYVDNSLIDMYGKCASLVDAHYVFDKCEMDDVISWSAIIAGYSQHGNVADASQLFHIMQQKGLKPTTITWNALISGYAQTKSGDIALDLFKQMEHEDVKPDSTTFVTILKACCNLIELKPFKLVHTLIVENNENMNIFVGNTLIDTYAKYGDIKDAIQIFWEAPVRDLVTWNIMIEGFVEHDHGKEALQYLYLMYQNGLKPDEVTYLSALKACSIAIALGLGMLIHEIVIEDGHELDTYIVSSLIDMYSKCEKFQEATNVFNFGCKESIETWNAMIVGSAFSGKYERAVDLCTNLRQHCIKPDGISFLCLMSACSHAGLVDYGCNHFAGMRNECRLRLSHEHYNGLIDLWGRVGHLQEAYHVAETMPLKPDAVSWVSLLYHCRIYGESELANTCLEHVASLEFDKSLPNSLISSVCGGSMLQNSEYAIQSNKSLESIKKESFVNASVESQTFPVEDQSYVPASHVNSRLKTINCSQRCEFYMS